MPPPLCLFVEKGGCSLKELAEDDCRRCHGCGKLADTADQEPWVFWEELPPESKLAVTVGLVKSMTCPDCNGTGKKPEQKGDGVGCKD